MSGHTPGPWTFRVFDGGKGHQWAVGIGQPGQLTHGVRGKEYMFVAGVCAKEDAQLMAAAPDLLEALQELEASTLPFGLMEQPKLKAQAAIAKATGASA